MRYRLRDARIQAMRLLLVEDDAMVGEAVRAGLRAEGFTVDWLRDGSQAEVACATVAYDVVLLDLGLPRREGLQVLATIRSAGNPVPVLIVTARDAVADRVRGLNAGADDYLIKPFDLDELVARIHALARRGAQRPQSELVCGDLVLNPATRAVHVAGRPVALSAREFALLQALMQRPSAVLSVAQLQDKVWGFDEEVASNAVEVHIHALRRKLGAERIRNVRGVGYTVSTASDHA
jgi:DNA-binding response OmpR family regulator